MSDSSIEALVDEMTLEEQVSLLSGEDFWSLPAVGRLGIGKLRVTDGPNGARGGGSLIGGVKSACFPVGIALGASWNPDLVREIGAALADEVKSKGAHVLLAPTVNIQRSVTNGRNFECYSEDPALSAALAVAYIEGLQAQGIAATVKHYAGNESEIQRTTMSSEIDERSLREVYLRPFEDAVKKAGSWAIMTSYNRLNGTYTSEHPRLLAEVLRGEWGFDGLVMSDWFGSHSTAPTVNAGLDLEMPGPTRDRGEKLLAAVAAGEVSAETVRARALNVLKLMERTGALHDLREHHERADDRPATRALIRRAGAEGAVLLKNDGILPLGRGGTGHFAVIGPNAQTAQIMGGGSAQLNPHYRVSPWEGLETALGGSERLVHVRGCDNHRFEPVLKGPFRAEYFASPDFSGGAVHEETMDAAEAFLFGRIAGGKVDPDRFTLRLTGTFRADRTGRYRVGIFSAGLSRISIDGRRVASAWEEWQPGSTFFEQGCDEVVAELDLAAGDHEVVFEFASRPARTLGISAFHAGIGLPLGDAEIAAAVEAARQAETALVFVGRNGEWDTEGSDLPHITLPGRQNELAAAVAAANPRTIVVLQTGGPVEMPWLDQVAAVLQAWYPGQEAGNAIADVLFGVAEPGGRLAQTFPRAWSDNPTASRDPEIYPGRDGRVRYAEGIFIGYRHYDRAGIAPLFPFGHGLGYARFTLGGLTADASAFASSGEVQVGLDLTNVGERAGATVVQIYVSDPQASVTRPAKELKSFAKVRLEAGEQRRVTLRLEARDFAFFDPEGRRWRVEAGEFEILAGFSAAEILARAAVTLDDRDLGLG
ncbi:MAG TPA: glycoside hydrolase family 3 C-terminal domain-containing protein [Paracoccaceae bacterium]|nr:glycoside hydrolase family 3 C-terminal domain-containing protein [Paracoccaceae bacterium]